MSVETVKVIGSDRPPVLIASNMLAWWDAGHDRLPWRETKDPYAIWVSEVMLQQTQVATVIPYYERWMAQFTTLASLAGAAMEEVLKQWEGLGYYKRAVNLHRAAQRVMKEYNGRLPADPKLLVKLPGIGRYTAAAIASIAYGVPAAVLDGNVIRVLARVIDLAEDVTKPATVSYLQDLAGSLVSPDRPGDYNQSLMELGRKVCRPIRPACSSCPLKGVCLAKAVGTQLDRPVRPPRKRTPHFHVTASVIWLDGDDLPMDRRRMLIAQRPLDDMLGGLWEFPGGKQKKGESLPECLKREIKEELDFEIEVGGLITSINHAYTHFRITLHAFHCRPVDGQPRAVQVANFTWVTLDELAKYPFPVTDQKIIASLRRL